jgi:hypothetical protein
MNNYQHQLQQGINKGASEASGFGQLFEWASFLSGSKSSLIQKAVQTMWVIFILFGSTTNPIMLHHFTLFPD